MYLIFSSFSSQGLPVPKLFTKYFLTRFTVAYRRLKKFMKNSALGLQFTLRFRGNKKWHLRLLDGCGVIPSVNSARSPVAPPFLEIAVPHHRLCFVVQHGAQSTPELGVDKLASSFPRKVVVVQLVRLVKTVKILGQIFGRRKIFDVNVRMRWCRTPIVCSPSAHYDRNYVVSTSQSQSQSIYLKHMTNVYAQYSVDTCKLNQLQKQDIVSLRHVY